MGGAIADRVRTKVRFFLVLFSRFALKIPLAALRTVDSRNHARAGDSQIKKSTLRLIVHHKPSGSIDQLNLHPERPAR